MTGTAVTVRLADGSEVSLDDDEVRALCEELWALGTEPGAVAIIGMIEHERRRNAISRHQVELTERETKIFSGALSTIRHS